MTVRPPVTALRAKFDRILPHLDERRRRLYIASEAAAIGHGGIALVAAASGASTAMSRTGSPSWPETRYRRGGSGPREPAASR